MRQTKFRLLVVLLIMIGMMTTGFGCKQGNLAAVNELNQQVTLKYWRVFDGKDAFDDVIADYQRLHPNVNIEYTKLRYEEYEEALLEAWAEDRGPDIFSIHNTWIGKYENKILEAPDSVKLPYVVEYNSRTRQIEKADYKQTKILTPFDVRNRFAEVVYQDVIRDDKILGLPLSVDTLALFYNRTLLDNAQVTKVPETWVEVKEAVKKLSLQNEKGEILQSGIALGEAENINRAADVLTLLMMQNGTEIADSVNKRIIFQETSPYINDKSYYPGIEALRFYTDFASPAKEVYTWNKDRGEATDEFIAGKLAMMLGYAYQLPLIKTQGAKLNIGVAEVPHIANNGSDALGSKINMASYWVETVSQKTKNPDYAWEFLQFMTNEVEAQKYLDRTKKPTALRSLVSGQLQDIDVAPFANQVLTAKSWYFGREPEAAEAIIREMIDNVTVGKATAEEAINFAAKRINQTF